MKRYHRPFPNTWWLARRPYFLFMLREVSSLFIGIFCLGLLCIVYQLSQSEEAYTTHVKAILRKGTPFSAVAILAFARRFKVTVACLRARGPPLLHGSDEGGEHHGKIIWPWPAGSLAQGNVAASTARPR